MKAKNISVILRRASFSKIANNFQSVDFTFEVDNIVVSENAPCNIKNDGTYPSKEGWVEIKNDFTNVPFKHCNIWVKTATLGGRRRTWVKNLK